MAIAPIEYEAGTWAEEETPRFVVVRSTPAPLRTGAPVQLRRAARARMLRRRRRAVAVAATVVALVILAWPGHAFGGTTAAGVGFDQQGGATLQAGEVYVVQPGDSVNSIARLINPWSPQLARRALERELHSDFVVPGEHVAVP